MLTSQFLLTTTKETPADAEIVSHQLMLRAGMIRRVAAGVYSWLPLGMRVLHKVEAIIREEMNNASAQEVFLPSVHPAELWRQSGRWDDYGPELLRFKDRHDREFCYGPTHEEVITMLAKSEIRSYRQLPMNLYQIQTKFRDEIRPRFGVMRSREFKMKDAYSFDIDEQGMQKAYDNMYNAYVRIFSRLGLETVAVAADSGAIGGNYSHEFHVLADSGEDGIAMCKECDFAANVELVTLTASGETRPAADSSMMEMDTPGVHTIQELCASLKTGPEKTLKTLLVEGHEGLVALVLRGDHELNAVKAEGLDVIRTPLRFASGEEIRTATGADAGSLGPVGLDIPVIADHSVKSMADFVCGANKNDKHLINVNWGRDLPEPEYADLRKAVAGDPCPTNPNHALTIRRGIEVGHVFQLGTKYSKALDATCLNENGRQTSIYMGCYGIGPTRIVAAAIEQSHDKNGVIWPASIAPFDVSIVPIGYNKSEKVAQKCQNLYKSLRAAGLEVLLDDRNERPGVMFADMDLIGIPHRLVVGDRGLDKGVVEYRARTDSESQDVVFDEVLENLIRLHKQPSV